jgi:signal transduction histidine kinase
MKGPSHGAARPGGHGNVPCVPVLVTRPDPVRQDSDVGLRLRPAHSALLLATVLVEATAIGLSWGREPKWDSLVYAVYALANVVAGVLILTRHPRHLIGRLLIATGLLQAVVSDLGQGWALSGTPRGWPGSAVADLAANSVWALGGGLMAATFVLFPDGRLPRSGRVWPWVLPVGGIGTLVLLAGWATGDQVDSLLVDGRNPLRSDTVPSGLLYWAGFVAVTAAMLLGVLAMVLRMHRAEGAERQQLKWMVFAVGIVVIVLLPTAPVYTSFVGFRIADALVLTALPLAALAAIWRYRLYDIELIVSRTVLYLAVSLVLGGLFAALVVGLGVVFGGGSTIATALATLLVALAFRPLRRWLQRYVDRWFDRGRYDALADVAAFMAELREGLSEPEKVSGVIAAASSRMRTPEAQAAIVPALESEASLAIEMVRLRAELRHQLEQVRDSRLRIVEAAEAERRRIERDLHDGAQQRLVSIGLALRHVQHELGESATGVSRTLDAAVQEVTDTIEELRDLARGIRPGVLDDGLAPALRDLAHRVQLPVAIEVPDLRYPKDVETAAYFIACEGVTNAVKHADASHLDLEVHQIDGRLVVRVSDDGVGGAEMRDGGGLVGVSDRVAAQGGHLTIESMPGRGTTLIAELSCGS